MAHDVPLSLALSVGVHGPELQCCRMACIRIGCFDEFPGDGGFSRTNAEKRT